MNIDVQSIMQAAKRVLKPVGEGLKAGYSELEKVVDEQMSAPSSDVKKQDEPVKDTEVSESDDTEKTES